jgi:hypothetical protein
MSDAVVETSQPLIDTDPPADPAPGAEDQKPTDPPSGADAKNPEQAESPEQQEARRESRRARQARRHAMELGEARAEARILREQLAARAQPQDPGEPKRDDFPDDWTYLRALTRFDAEQATEARLNREREASQGQAQQGRQAATQAELARQWTERENAYRAKNPKYEQVVTSYAKTDLGELSDHAKRLIISSELGPNLLAHLAENPAEHDRIAVLSPERQLIELGKLEDKVSTPPAKAASNAPPPVSRLPQGQSAPTGYREDMGDAEYKAMRKSQGARWAQ